MAVIAADWLADKHPEDDDVPMDNMVVDDPAPTPSSVPSVGVKTGGSRVGAPELCVEDRW